MIRYRCPRCRSVLEAESAMAGKQDKCPLCRQVSVVPSARNLRPFGIAIAGALVVLFAVGAAVPLSSDEAPDRRPGPEMPPDSRPSPLGRAGEMAGPNQAGAEQGGLSTKELFRQCSPAVVKIVSTNTQGRLLGQGSGFLVSTDGLVVTSYHVIKGCQRAVIHMTGGSGRQEMVVKGVVALDMAGDLALLRVDTGGLRVTFLELAGGPLPEVGTEVFAIGSPEGLENSFTKGIVSGHRKASRLGSHYDESMYFLQISTPISRGSSGGPLLTEDGKVVGVTSASYHEASAQNLNFAVPANRVSKLLTQRGKLQSLASAANTADTDTGNRTFNSQLSLKVYTGTLDGGTELVGATPSETLLEIPECPYWWVEPRGPVDMAKLSREIHSKRVTGLALLVATDADLAHLKGLTGLQRLYLSETDITDAGLAHLKELTGLKRLYLNRTSITDGGLRELRKALPGTDIRFP